MIEVGIFAAKALIIVVSIGILVLLIAGVASKAGQKSDLEIEPINKKLKNLAIMIKSVTMTKDDFKNEKKRFKKETKKEAKEDKAKVFVLNFEGDLKASQVENLREEVTAILQVATPKDEIIVNLESPGGVVHGYGLAASQLLRFRDKGIPITACVDKVAASGGYLMACVANRVIAAPFAIVGSIGVVAQVPNIHRLLKKFDVDYKEYTAGEFKRTVSFLGEITPKGEQKFLEQIEQVHSLFKKFVSTHRPNLNLEVVATGEYWYGEQAKALGLIDHIQTSDDYLLEKFAQELNIYTIKCAKSQHWWSRLSESFAHALTVSLNRVLESMINRQNL